MLNDCEYIEIETRKTSENYASLLPLPSLSGAEKRMSNGEKLKRKCHASLLLSWEGKID